MTTQKRTFTTLSGLLTALLLVVGGSQVAQASDAGQGSVAPDGTRVTDVSTQDRTFVLPPAPAEARSGGDFGAMAVPTISPTVAVSYANPGGEYTCEYATLCAWAWDTSHDKWKIFHLYNCHKYALSNWIGNGGFNNNQTRGTVARFYGQNGSTQVAPASTAYEIRSVNRGDFGGWSPVWFVRNC
ncbi:hypothetical protein APR04_002167 [Promicromonospora umidemergens]|uniref:Peptidase inhibitor family I36 n=1 Tax=Promicromonospora umidemergens TaxID=629679 RepID=A0ABP8WR87_9MICO|nr:hypothetical protein [Promicromonospora umidemergens]MCP2283264.1 hypothetical protein [Promicromonospora umidemergens]